MYIYILNLCVICLGALFSRGHYNGRRFNKKMLYIFVATQLILVVALRDISIGADTISYMNLNHYIRDTISSVSELFSDWYINDYWRYEKGYSFYCYFFVKLGLSDQAFVFINSLIALIPVMVLIYKKSEHPFVSLLLFVIFGMYSFSFNTMRQYLAIGLTSIAYLLYDKEEKKYLAIPFLIGAVLLHSTSIVVLLMIVTKFVDRITPIKTLLSYLIFTVFFVLGDYLVGKIFMQFDKYSSQTMTGQNSIATILAFLAVFMYLVIINNGLFKGNDKDYMIFLYIYIIMLTTGMFAGIMARCSLYFYIGAVIGIPNLLLKKKTHSNYTILLVIVLLFSYQYFKSVWIDPSLMPYKWGLW